MLWSLKWLIKPCKGSFRPPRVDIAPGRVVKAVKSVVLAFRMIDIAMKGSLRPLRG